MTVTLAQAIVRVRFLLDDKDNNPLISDAEITTALQVAQEEVWQSVVDSGANIYYQSADVSSSSAGAISLASITPLKIANVALVVGNGVLQVPPCRVFDGFANVTSVQPCRIMYVPRAAFPALSSDPFIWSQASISLTTLDQLLCHTAASMCWVKTGEPPLSAMEKRRAELQASCTSTINLPGWSVTPLTLGVVRDSGIYWRRSAHDQIQLVNG
jgi:hypothetical protein